MGWGWGQGLRGWGWGWGEGLRGWGGDGDRGCGDGVGMGSFSVPMQHSSSDQVHPLQSKDVDLCLSKALVLVPY